MDFWRGEAYTKFFEYLDGKGGFYYEVCLPSVPLRKLILNVVKITKSDGVMHPCIQLQQHCSRLEIRFTSSMISDMSITHTPTVPKTKRHGSRDDVHVTQKKALVRFLFSYNEGKLTSDVDYDGYSCMSKWDRFIEKR